MHEIDIECFGIKYKKSKPTRKNMSKKKARNSKRTIRHSKRAQKREPKRAGQDKITQIITNENPSSG